MNNNKGKLGRALEIATNLSIIALALVATTVLIKNYLLRSKVTTVVESASADRNSLRSAPNPRPDRPSPAGPAVGTQISLPGINWGESDETVLLALSNKCHFCSESAPFYQKLMGELSGRKDVRVVAVFPQEASEGKKYLEGLNVPITEVAQASLDSLGVRGTPTLLIVDKSGAVKQSWVGRLTADRESEVLSRVKS